MYCRCTGLAPLRCARLILAYEQNATPRMQQTCPLYLLVCVNNVARAGACIFARLNFVVAVHSKRIRITVLALLFTLRVHCEDCRRKHNSKQRSWLSQERLRTNLQDILQPLQCNVDESLGNSTGDCPSQEKADAQRKAAARTTAV